MIMDAFINAFTDYHGGITLFLTYLAICSSAILGGEAECDWDKRAIEAHMYEFEQRASIRDGLELVNSLDEYEHNQLVTSPLARLLQEQKRQHEHYIQQAMKIEKLERNVDKKESAFSQLKNKFHDFDVLLHLL